MERHKPVAGKAKPKKKPSEETKPSIKHKVKLKHLKKHEKDKAAVKAHKEAIEDAKHEAEEEAKKEAKAPAAYRGKFVRIVDEGAGAQLVGREAFGTGETHDTLTLSVAGKKRSMSRCSRFY